MKFLLTFFIFFLVPAILFLALLYAVVPLFMQRCFYRNKNGDKKIYLYQTSWEEAA